jgi:hypothetical protein
MDSWLDLLESMAFGVLRSVVGYTTKLASAVPPVRPVEKAAMALPTGPGRRPRRQELQADR